MTFDVIPDQKTRAAVFRLGESHIELLEPTVPDSPIGRFLDKRGEGIHHVCFRVDDIYATIARLRRARIKLIDEEPRQGAGGCLVCFVHPSSTGGVLIELSQPATSQLPHRQGR